MGAWPGTLWSSIVKPLAERVDGTGAGRIAKFVHPDDSQQQTPAPLYNSFKNDLRHIIRQLWRIWDYNSALLELQNIIDVID